MRSTVAKSKKRAKKQQAYIKKHYRVLKTQYDYIKSELGWANDDTIRFVGHVLSCQLYKYKEGGEGYVCVPWEIYNRSCPDVEIGELESYGIIEIKVIDELRDKTYSKWDKIARSYRVVDTIVDKFIELGTIKAAEYMKATKVNLFDGKPCSKTEKTRFTDENKNKVFPELISEAIEHIDNCIVELAPIERHVADLKLEMDGEAVFNGVDSHDYIKARGRYYNDYAVLKDLLNQNPVEVLPGFYEFKAPYKASNPGRIHTFMQNASKEMKAAAFSNVDNLKNYDLRSSQAIGLIKQFKLARLDTTWLEDYKDNKQAKHDYAAEIGISVDTWKQCLCAVLMGGHVPKKINSKGKIMEYLMEEAGGDLTLAVEYLSKFSNVIAPLENEIKLWHDWLLDTYVESVGTYGAGKLYLSNATNSKLCVDDLPEGKDIWQRKAKVAAFVLQGQEAAFIHNLTILSIEYGYKVLQNEHDGLITVGPIPQEAVDKAAVAAGMEYARLEDKPFT